VTESEPLDGPWMRVSRKYIVVDVVGYLISGAVLVMASFIPFLAFGWQFSWILPIGMGVVVLVTVALTPRRVKAIGYQLRADDLLFRRGIMWQRFVAVPYGRMQLVDINRGPIARTVGLSELRFVTAAAATSVVIPGLPEAVAEELRDHLVALAESRRSGL
jgi:uncharacterized protein